MAPLHISTHGLLLTLTAQPLTPDAFAPFGEVIQNPRPDVHPSRFADAGPLPSDAISANQGSAIKYQHVTRMLNRYHQAPSGVPGVAVMNMFVCASRKLQSRRAGRDAPTLHTGASSSSSSSPGPGSSSSFFEVNILERHPYTTQTFTPLSISGPASAAARNRQGYYLVIVAPNVAGPPPDPSPASPAASPPDLAALRAFVATTDQAVTYGAGTWHAPMVALGPEGSTVDFVVTQFANAVGNEDCQEVVFGGPGEGSIFVEVVQTTSSTASKL